LTPLIRKIIAEIGEPNYDYLDSHRLSRLIFFGNKGDEAIVNMKTIPQALNIRSFILRILNKRF
jgi:hypothetical protein